MILCSDQIPVWVKLSSDKQIYLQREYNPAPIEDIRKSIQNCTHSNEGSDAIVVSRPLAEELSSSGQRQLRSKKQSGDEKVRWTYEARQEVHNFFDPEAKPIGKQGKGCLILSGTRARLSNISKDGLFIETEQFELGGKLIVRKAGTNAFMFAKNSLFESTIIIINSNQLFFAFVKTYFRLGPF